MVYSYSTRYNYTQFIRQSLSLLLSLSLSLSLSLFSLALLSPSPAHLDVEAIAVVRAHALCGGARGRHKLQAAHLG